MKFTISNGKNFAHLLANDTQAEFTAKCIISKFLPEQQKNGIFICYHVKDTIVLLHFKVLDSNIDIASAIKLVKEDLLSDDLYEDDANLKLALKDPQASTAKFLLDFIASEEELLAE